MRHTDISSPQRKRRNWSTSLPTFQATHFWYYLEVHLHIIYILWQYVSCFILFLRDETYITAPTCAFFASSRGSALNPLHSGNVSHNTAGTHATSWLQTSQRLSRGSPKVVTRSSLDRDYQRWKKISSILMRQNLLNSPWEVSLKITT